MLGELKLLIEKLLANGINHRETLLGLTMLATSFLLIEVETPLARRPFADPGVRNCRTGRLRMDAHTERWTWVEQAFYAGVDGQGNIN